MNTWKAAASQVTQKWKKATIRGTRCWRYSRYRDPAQRSSSAYMIGSCAGWHCRATSRWTLFTCPWSGKQGSDCDTPTHSVRAACYATSKCTQEWSQFCFELCMRFEQLDSVDCSGDHIALWDLSECPHIIIIVKQPLCSNSDSQWVLKFLQKIVYTACAHCRWACSSPHLGPCCLAFGVLGDYEELLTATQGGVVESCDVDEKRGLRYTSLREWLAGF